MLSSEYGLQKFLLILAVVEKNISLRFDKYLEAEVCTGHTLADFLPVEPYKFELQVLLHKSGFTEMIHLKSDSQRNVPPSSVNIFPSIGARQSLWHDMNALISINNLQIKQPRWSSLPPTFNQLLSKREKHCMMLSSTRGPPRQLFAFFHSVC